MTEKNISLDGVHEQLVDINNGVGDFSVVILVTPPAEEMDKEYNIGIGTQAQIDNKKEISFSAIKGIYKKSFTHSPVNPTGDPDVFYLIMSSQTPVDNIKVRIDLADNAPLPHHKVSSKAHPTIEHFEAPNKKILYIKYAISVVILIIGAYFIYKFWKKSSADKASAKETVKETVKEVVKETKEAVNEVVKEAVKEVVNEAAKITLPPPVEPVRAVIAPKAPARVSVPTTDSPVKRIEKPKTTKPTFSFY